jgi:peptidyl-prolyl cis-trans isomerase B (cyclophilin B)
LKTLIFSLILAFSFASSFANNAEYIKKNNPGEKPQYEITVTQAGKTLGKIVIETFPQIAPAHCRNFDSLVSIGFYNGTKFHRVIAGFMIQGGDPNSKDLNAINMWGYGAPGQTTVVAEFNPVLSHTRGMISQARSQDPNSGTSQFFICHGNPTQLDRQYSIWGQVLSGMEIVDIIANAPKNSDNRPNEHIEMQIIKLVTPMLDMNAKKEKKKKAKKKKK